MSAPPASASRRASSPAVSRGPIAIASSSRMGPVSSPASMSIVETPVRASPAATAAWMGEAPRQRGRSEAWRLTQPCRGRSSRARGKICPKATTTATSGLRAATSSRKAGSPTRSGCITGTPCPRAQRATGGSCGCWPRPARRAGWVTTRTGARPAPTSAARVGTANSGVPKKTIRSIADLRAKDSTGEKTWPESMKRPVLRRGVRGGADAGLLVVADDEPAPADDGVDAGFVDHHHVEEVLAVRELPGVEGEPPAGGRDVQIAGVEGQVADVRPRDAVARDAGEAAVHEDLDLAHPLPVQGPARGLDHAAVDEAAGRRVDVAERA